MSVFRRFPQIRSEVSGIRYKKGALGCLEITVDFVVAAVFGVSVLVFSR